MTKHFPRSQLIRPRSRKDDDMPVAPAGPSSLEVVEAFDEFMMAFEAFKDANDERLAQIENRVSARPASL